MRGSEKLANKNYCIEAFFVKQNYKSVQIPSRILVLITLLHRLYPTELIPPLLFLANAIGRVSVEPRREIGWMCPRTLPCFFFDSTKSPHPRQP
jgi:hypothetical protein